MKIKALICSAFILLLFNASANENPKDTLSNRLQSNTIAFSAGFFPVFGVLNLHYERKILVQRTGPFKTYYLSGNVGTWSGIKFNGHHAGIGFCGLTGLGKNHFEMRLGATSIIETDRYHNEKNNPSNFPDKQPALLKNYIAIWPSVGLGYRYQKPGKPFVFRTGVGYPDAVYLSVGIAFH